jgi:hypothetical protein
MLARCYWQLGRLPEAAHEFDSAIARKEAPEAYLRLCRAACNEKAVSASTRTSAAVVKD